MTQVTPPYFFDEFLQTTLREAPTPREHALGLTLRDLDWLHAVYLVTDSARKHPPKPRDPMNVVRLLITHPGKGPIPLAGVFMMSPTPDSSKAVLYSPYGGLEVFDSDTTLLTKVLERLKRSSQRADLVQFLSIGERDTLPENGYLKVTTAPIPGMVLPDQEKTILAGQQKNVTAMLSELRRLPDLHHMLDKMLEIMAYARFPRLTISDTYVNFSSRLATGTDSSTIVSEPLHTVVLQRYINQSWPKNQTHTYHNPGLDTRQFTQDQLTQDQQHWDAIVEETASAFRQLLHSQLETYWNEALGNTQSRRQFFAQAMSDKFRAELALKHQEQIISSDESLTLRSTFLADQDARDAADSSLKTEKVRIHAPYQHYVDLASTLMLSNSHAYLYSQSRGLQVLKDLSELKAILQTMLKTTGHKDELLNFLSLDDRDVFIAMEHMQVTGLPVTGDVFQEMVDDIIAKQFDNLDHALGLYRQSNGSTDLAALLDSALDVRALVDNRLLGIDTDGRWSVHPITLGDGSPTTVTAEKARHHMRRLQAVSAALEKERDKHPNLRQLASTALQAELHSLQLNLTPGNIFINTYDATAQNLEEHQPQSSIDMVDHLLARLTRQTNAVISSPRIGLYGPRESVTAKKLPGLTITAFNTVITKVLNSFTQHLLPVLPQRFLDSHQTHLSLGLLQGLSGEAELRRISNSLPLRHLALLDSVLNADSMTRLTRHGLNGFIPDAFGLSVTIGTSTEAHPLANTFALTERGGTDNVLSGAALLWTVRRGLEAFDSIKQLREVLEQRLQDPSMRIPLIENLPAFKRIPHQTYGLGPLQRIDDHLLNNRQHSYSELIREAFKHLLSVRLTPKSFEHHVDGLIQRVPPSNLRRAIHIASTMTHRLALPAWLGTAMPAEQIMQAELITQYRLSAPDEHDYLHDVIPIRDKVRLTLSDLLVQRFPNEAALNPEQIHIQDLNTLEGGTQTLTDFALGHFAEMDADNIRATSRTETPLPATLDGSAVVQLVRQLDLKSLYQTILAVRLDGQTENSRKRRQLFYRQLPWQLLRYAHEQMLKERLSSEAWCLIKQVFDMPDEVARAAVVGVNAMIRPLELIATQGASTAKALACYLIGPKIGATGPLVLYAPYSPGHVLKEYADEVALLNEFIRPGALQDWVVSQLEEVQQETYRHLLLDRRRRQAPEIRLGSSPISANLLKQLYQDNRKMLTHMLGTQFAESGESKWKTITGLLAKELPKSVEFVAGKLTYPLVVWRSYKLFKTSAEDLQQHRWLHALKTFAEGVAELASLREELDKLMPDVPVASAPPTLEEEGKAASTPSPTLATHDMTAPLRTQLQIYENHDVALADLKHDPKTNVYSDEAATLKCVPMAGKVYPVKKAGDGWRISSGERHGPFVQRNVQGDWVLDLDQHQARYGKAISRYVNKRETKKTLRRFVNIEATGRQAIADFSPTQAESLDEAINVATYYTTTCKRNFEYFSQTHDPRSRLGQFFTTMFGVGQLSPDQAQKVRQRIDELLDELSNQTLVAPTSMRFVSASPLYHTLEDVAFTVTNDPQQKIYLMENFFTPQLSIYSNLLNADFDIDAHARAATLIHEITHLTSSTEDLAYLDSMRPFPDKMDMRMSQARTMRHWLVNLRETELSAMTPATRLFKQRNKLTLQLEDFGQHESTKNLLEKVLSTTGAGNIQDARNTFFSNADKRIDTILANADSIAHMVTELGRQLDAGA